MKKGKIFKKILCTQLIVISILANSFNSSISYAESDSLSKLGEDIVSDIKEKGSSVVYHWTKKGFENHEVKKYGGYKPLAEAKNNLKKVISGESEIKVYGQDEAKKKMFPFAMTSLVSIDQINEGRNSEKEKTGNVVYMIGPSGSGKTTMAKAISEALLNSPDKTVFFIDPSAISSSKPLGEQLFQTFDVKDLNKEDEHFGLNEKETKSPILAHILKWKEAIVIIDDYDKMKKIRALAPENMNQCDEAKEDKTADEILKSISDTGKYRVAGNEIDCSKVIFIITTNEEKEELKRNFGIGGVKGGGVQRINILEFKRLSLESCKKIVIDMLNHLQKDLTYFNGRFKIHSFTVDEQSINKMAEDIFNDNINQGRLKRTFKSEILSLFALDIGEEFDKSFVVFYTPSKNPGEIGTFKRIEISETCIDNTKTSSYIKSHTSQDDDVVKVFPPKQTISNGCNSQIISYTDLFTAIQGLNGNFNPENLKKIVNINLNKNDKISEEKLKAYKELMKTILLRLSKQIESGNWKNNNCVKISVVDVQGAEFVAIVKFSNNGLENFKDYFYLESNFIKINDKIKSIINQWN